MNNSMYACLPCRRGGKTGGLCRRCGAPMADFGPRVTIPKKNNKKAWDSILSGDMYWDKKKVAKKPHIHQWRAYNLDRIKLERAKRLLVRWSGGNK